VTVDDLTVEACDHCDQDVHPDRNGYWVGEDKTSDCPAHERGHTVDGEIRA